MTIGEGLKLAIQHWGRSIRAFQREMRKRDVRGSSYASINSYLHDRRDPPLEFLHVAARVLGVREGWLMARDGEMIVDILEVAVEYQDYWNDKSDHYWFARLVQEVGELGSALVGDHKDSPERELTQIASIAINWLKRFERDGERNHG